MNEIDHYLVKILRYIYIYIHKTLHYLPLTDLERTLCANTLCQRVQNCFQIETKYGITHKCDAKGKGYSGTMRESKDRNKEKERGKLRRAFLSRLHDNY